MILTILYRYPNLPSSVHTALRALLWAVALLAALALLVAIVMALAPYLPSMMAAGSVVWAYALLTMPRTARTEVQP